MKYRKLGNTDLEISEVGYGTWQLANDPGIWVGADLDESRACLKEFTEQGGNFIDTAWIYGWDENKPDEHPSEELIGTFLRENNLYDKITVATKVPPKNITWPAWKGVGIEEIFPSDHVEKCVDDSLRSLGVESIDLMQFHVWQDEFSENEDLLNTIDKITRSGKVRYWGISVNDYQPSNCIKSLDTGLFSSIQTIFNVFHQKPREKLFKYAKENNIGIIARVPLDEGGLSGKFTKDTVFPEGDFRGAYFTKERLGELTKRIDRLQALADEYNIGSVPEMALRFILSNQEVTAAIPGMRKMKHLKSNIAITDKSDLPEELMDKLYGESWERNFYPDVDPSMKNSGFME